ncbi:MAG: type IV pilus modification protein PilV [Acinetobacter sp.]
MLNKNCSGESLVEVMVALLLLGVGVLGFALLQLRAVDASNQGFKQTLAMNIARDLAEKMRINYAAYSSYQRLLASPSTSASVGQTCYDKFCSASAKASADVYEAYIYATQLGMRLSMLQCPATANDRQCIYVAWGNTSPTDNRVHDEQNVPCTLSNNSGFHYHGRAQCIVLEAY